MRSLLDYLYPSTNRMVAFTFDAAAHQMQWAFRENRQRVWHVEPAYTESIYSTVMSGTIVVRATETSFVIDLSRDGPPP